MNRSGNARLLGLDMVRVIATFVSRLLEYAMFVWCVESVCVTKLYFYDAVFYAFWFCLILYISGKRFFGFLQYQRILEEKDYFYFSNVFCCVPFFSGYQQKLFFATKHIGIAYRNYINF